MRRRAIDLCDSYIKFYILYDSRGLFLRFQNGLSSAAADAFLTIQYDSIYNNEQLLQHPVLLSLLFKRWSVWKRKRRQKLVSA